MLDEEDYEEEEEEDEIDNLLKEIVPEYNATNESTRASTIDEDKQRMEDVIQRKANKLKIVKHEIESTQKEDKVVAEDMWIVEAITWIQK